jgi:UDP-N-acetylmuramoyl-tripeptide--D-alanyl-D-alanine ligase
MIGTERLHEAFLRTKGACTDTRALIEGGMFFALKGPNFNANAFASQALDAGCGYAVVDDPAVVTDERFLLVPDVLRALQELARHHRRSFGIPLIAITGTNGKTTTKELVHVVMSADRPTLATSGNLNNHIGVPLTLLRLTPEHRFAIIEMGANHIGDIAELVSIAEPTHGLITNIGRAHLEGFGGYEGVIKAKTEMYDFISANKGTVFVHGDDPLLMARTEGLQRVTYGTSEAFSTNGRATSNNGPFMGLVFDAKDGAGHYDLITHLIGDYNAPNALAAVCIGQYFNVPDEVIAGALSGYTPSNNRSQFSDTGRNHLVLDAYNANPSSMKVALENFAAMHTSRPKLALLGGMKELGDASRTEHETIVSLVNKLGLEAIYVGPEFLELSRLGINVYPDAGQALSALNREPRSGQLILIKGSRGTKLETLLPAL